MTSAASAELGTGATLPGGQPQGQWSGVHAPVSVVILSLNEEINIKECLASCAWCGDIHLLDSGSLDGTQEIARELGAIVHVNQFESFGKQRNWAIDNITVKNDWVFHLDADERFTPEQVREMQRVLAENPQNAGYHVPSRLMFMGKWLKHSGGYPTYQMRLFHRDRMRFQDYGHGQMELTRGRIVKLKKPYLHYNFSKGIDEWYSKHNSYSRKEAQLAFDESRPTFELMRTIILANAVERRRAMKSLSYTFPFRATFIGLYMLFIQLGLFDGKAGWNYIRMRTTYERMIDTKLSALRHKNEAHCDD
jgi:glycosyltransferase involved in cell wall biosynthesis